MIPSRRGHPLRHAAARGRQPARDRRGRRPRHLRLQVPRRRPGRCGCSSPRWSWPGWPSGSGCARRALVALDLDPEIARYEADEEVQDLLNASAGLNLGADFLPGLVRLRRARAGRRRRDPARVLWLDAFVANVDRSWRNPNLLLWHGNLWVIDHGAALYFHHGWSGGVGDPARFAAQPWSVDDHVLPRPRRRAGRRSTPSCADAAQSRRLRRGAGRGARRVAGAGARRRRPDAVRAAYVAFLTARLGATQWLPGSGA